MDRTADQIIDDALVRCEKIKSMIDEMQEKGRKDRIEFAKELCNYKNLRFIRHFRNWWFGKNWQSLPINDFFSVMDKQLGVGGS